MAIIAKISRIRLSMRYSFRPTKEIPAGYLLHPP
jgi:hypothetical protein